MTGIHDIGDIDACVSTTEESFYGKQTTSIHWGRDFISNRSVFCGIWRIKRDWLHLRQRQPQLADVWSRLWLRGCPILGRRGGIDLCQHTRNEDPSDPAGKNRFTRRYKDRANDLQKLRRGPETGKYQNGDG